jgi:hypothetical protein
MPKMPKMPKVKDRLSPSCKLYPPACKTYGLEAEPEDGGSILLKEKSKVCDCTLLLVADLSC